MNAPTFIARREGTRDNISPAPRRAPAGNTSSSLDAFNIGYVRYPMSSSSLPSPPNATFTCGA